SFSRCGSIWLSKIDQSTDYIGLVRTRRPADAPDPSSGTTVGPKAWRGEAAILFCGLAGTAKASDRGTKDSKTPIRPPGVSGQGRWRANDIRLCEAGDHILPGRSGARGLLPT